MEYEIALVIGIVIILLALFLTLWIFILVAKMAIRRGRSGLFWVIFSLFTTPIVSAILLLCLGETDAYRRRRIIEEETLRYRTRFKLDEESNGRNDETPRRETYAAKSDVNPDEEGAGYDRNERENPERFMPR